LGCDGPRNNHYASQYMEKYQKKYVHGKTWKPVTVTDMITYFGMLIYLTKLYPQTSQPLHSTWKDQEFNF